MRDRRLAGQWLACAGICLTPVYPSVTEFVLAFLLFRLFDILKPWPISAAEKLPGGLGVMADDMVAGLAAAIIAGALQYFRWCDVRRRAAGPGADVLDAARARNIRIVTAESCNWRIDRGLLTEIPGSSDVVERGFRHLFQ